MYSIQVAILSHTKWCETSHNVNSTVLHTICMCQSQEEINCGGDILGIIDNLQNLQNYVALIYSHSMHEKASVIKDWIAVEQKRGLWLTQHIQQVMLVCGGKQKIVTPLSRPSGSITIKVMCDLWPSTNNNTGHCWITCLKKK